MKLMSFTTLRGWRFSSIQEDIPSDVTVSERRNRIDRCVATAAAILAGYQRMVEPHWWRVPIVCDDIRVHSRAAVGRERMHDGGLTAAMAQTEPRYEDAVDDGVKADVGVA